MVKNDQEMIKFFILYTPECWKDNLEQLMIIYLKWYPTMIVPFRKEETDTFLNVFFQRFDHIIKPNCAIKSNYVIAFNLFL